MKSGSSPDRACSFAVSVSRYAPEWAWVSVENPTEWLRRLPGNFSTFRTPALLRLSPGGKPSSVNSPNPRSTSVSEPAHSLFETPTVQ